MPMQRAGEVVGTAQGLAIVRCHGEDRVDIGAGLIDESLSQVGRVVDVFGPVSRPYLAVTPAPVVSLPGLLGTKLYAR
jgi:RNA-binding protein